jgi:hypothetical protein
VSSVSVPTSPFKGLAAFEDSELDALLFFGRERESEVIASNLMASRLTVLFGPTGVGKSSVLRAGVVHRLRRETGVEIVVHSSWTGDPVSAIEETAGVSGSSLADALGLAAARAGGDLYLVLDQFEEYFLYHERDRRFVEELAEVVRRPGLRVNVLIGIREDALAHSTPSRRSSPISSPTGCGWIRSTARRAEPRSYGRSAATTSLSAPNARSRSSRSSSPQFSTRSQRAASSWVSQDGASSSAAQTEIASRRPTSSS